MAWTHTIDSITDHPQTSRMSIAVVTLRKWAGDPGQGVPVASYTTPATDTYGVIKGSTLSLAQIDAQAEAIADSLDRKLAAEAESRAEIDIPRTTKEAAQSDPKSDTYQSALAKLSQLDGLAKLGVIKTTDAEYVDAVTAAKAAKTDLETKVL